MPITDIKTDLFSFWAEDENNLIGKENMLMTCDGHGTNVLNLGLVSCVVCGTALNCLCRR